jgi:hypothetical protein
MSGADSAGVSRRQFLAGCGAVGAAAVGTPLASAAQHEPERPGISLPSAQPFTAGSRISPQGRARIAAVDRQFQQQRSQMSKTLDAVEDLGLDPSGSEPINGKLASAIEGLSNVRVVFPSDGVFRATEQVVVRPAGPIELVGNGCTFKLDADREQRILNIDEFPTGSLFQGFTFTSTGDTTVGFRVATDGTVRVQDVTVKGYMVSDQSNKNRVQAVFSPVARSSSATVQVRNYRAIGGSAAGTHDQDDKPESAKVNQIASPMGVWVGQQTKGTIQLVECQLRGWSNGVYGGRTNGRVEVSGGQYWNNLNSQLRLGGGSIVDGATLLLDDREWSMNQNPGPYSLGEQQGVHAIRVDAAAGGNTSDPIRIRNTEVQSKSMQQGVAEIEFESESGPGIIENSRIVSHIERPVINAHPPAGGISQSNILVNNSYIGGKGPSTVVSIEGRPQSRIQQTCVAIPGTGPSAIEGAKVGSGVSFGEGCKGSGLRAPKKVGSGGNISSLPAPNGSVSTGAGASSSSGGGGMGWGGKLLGSMVAAPLIAMVVMILPIIFGLVMVGGVVFGGLLFFFKKLGS